MSSIFLSHSHADKSFVRKLAATIRRRGHFVWLDEAEILVGDSLIEKLREGIDQVDYVVVVLSKASIQSEWVKRELDIAMNREIGEKRVVVLPLRVEKVELPGFLKGKLYIDFSAANQYAESVARLMRRLGPTRPARKITPEEFRFLKQELENARAIAKQSTTKTARNRKLSKPQRSSKAQAAIRKANKQYLDHALINNAYAFELGDEIITLDYVLWAIGKAKERGGHPIEVLLTLEGKWGNVLLMLEAYRDYMGIQ